MHNNSKNFQVKEFLRSFKIHWEEAHAYGMKAYCSQKCLSAERLSGGRCCWCIFKNNPLLQLHNESGSFKFVKLYSKKGGKGFSPPREQGLISSVSLSKLDLEPRKCPWNLCCPLLVLPDLPQSAHTGQIQDFTKDVTRFFALSMWKLYSGDFLWSTHPKLWREYCNMTSSPSIRKSIIFPYAAMWLVTVRMGKRNTK